MVPNQATAVTTIRERRGFRVRSLYNVDSGPAASFSVAAMFPLGRSAMANSDLYSSAPPTYMNSSGGS